MNEQLETIDSNFLNEEVTDKNQTIMYELLQKVMDNHPEDKVLFLDCKNGMKWFNDDGDLEFSCFVDLMNLYIKGNLECVFNVTKSVVGMTIENIIRELHQLSMSDLELLYEVCSTGTHHNGRDVEWMNGEGLYVEELS